MPRKHVALRTCVHCQQVRPKRELIRIVRTPQGTIEINEKGKAAGRGAYLCRNRACWEQAVPRERLDYALKVKLSPEDKERLLQYGQQLPYADTVLDPARPFSGREKETSTEDSVRKGERDSHRG